MTIITCPKCGTASPPHTARCRTCSASLISTERFQRQAPPVDEAPPVTTRRVARHAPPGRGLLLLVLLAAAIGAVAYGWSTSRRDPLHETPTGARFRLPAGFRQVARNTEEKGGFTHWKDADARVQVATLHGRAAVGPALDREAMVGHLHKILDMSGPELTAQGYPSCTHRLVGGRATVECTAVDAKFAEVPDDQLPADEVRRVHFVFVREGSQLFVGFVGYNHDSELVERMKASFNEVSWR